MSNIGCLGSVARSIYIGVLVTTLNPRFSAYHLTALSQSGIAIPKWLKLRFNCVLRFWDMVNDDNLVRHWKLGKPPEPWSSRLVSSWTFLSVFLNLFLNSMSASYRTWNTWNLPFNALAHALLFSKMKRNADISGFVFAMLRLFVYLDAAAQAF